MKLDEPFFVDPVEAQSLCTVQNQGFSVCRQFTQPDSHLFQPLKQA